MIDDNAKMNIRMTLAVQLNKPLPELKELYDWVVGTPASIIPIKDFKIVKS